MKPLIAILSLICLLATATTVARLGYDIHYKRVYQWSADGSVHAYPDAILAEIGRAEHYGQWRPEMPYLEARAWIECDLQGRWTGTAQMSAQESMGRAKRLAPHAWWVKQLTGEK